MFTNSRPSASNFKSFSQSLNRTIFSHNRPEQLLKQSTGTILKNSYFLIFSVTDLIAELNEVFLKLVYAWDQDPRASRILRQIMEYVSNPGKNMLSWKSYKHTKSFFLEEGGNFFMGNFFFLTVGQNKFGNKIPFMLAAHMRGKRSF